MTTPYERNTYFNLTQPIILSGMLKHWFQLEKFRTNEKERTSSLQGTIITEQMFIAEHIKAFEWTSAKIECIEPGISRWNQLEYFKLQQTSLPYGIPNDFHEMGSMKYLSLVDNGLTTFPDSICKLTNLEILDIQLEPNIKSIHPCIANLTQLKQLIIENCVRVEEIPLSVFNLSNLVVLSLFNNLISLQSLIEYNVPKDMDKNDTDGLVEWFKDALIIGSNIEDYYLAWNPICDENITWFAAELTDSMREACDYPCEIRSKGVFEVEDRFCSPRLLGNGRCDLLCNNGNCFGDNGDCAQLCLSSLTDCTFDLYTNDQCDDMCSNQYCTMYRDKYFAQPYILSDGRGPDNFRCRVNTSFGESSQTNRTCKESNSTYTDLHHRENVACRTVQWVGDGVCDDFCRTDECDHDGGDCDPGSCINNKCSHIHNAWLLFVSPSAFIVNISYFCETMYPNAVLIFGFNPEVSCYERSLWDWNNDTFLNFREFTHVAYRFAGG
eukprot:224785_1